MWDEIVKGRQPITKGQDGKKQYLVKFVANYLTFIDEQMIRKAFGSEIDKF